MIQNTADPGSYKHINHCKPECKGNDSDSSVSSPTGNNQEIGGEEEDDDEEEDDELDSDVNDQHSGDLKLLSLDSLGHDDTFQCSSLITKTIDSTTVPLDGVPVKRKLRRNRKRMSDDERRLRHREVQRQFMKRKRARLGEMRKFLRGLQSQHRLVQVMNERAELENHNRELRVRLAMPRSGWQWEQHSSPSHPPSAAPMPTPIPIPAPPPEPVSIAINMHTYPAVIYHPSIIYHHHEPPVYQDHHIATHRPPHPPGVFLPWDEILDAVTNESSADHGHSFQDMSF